MNNEVFLDYKGEKRNFDEVKKVKIKYGKGSEEYSESWGGKYAGIPKMHPLELHRIISDILNENPQIKGIIEIGTYFGALSCYLGAECVERGFKPLLTFDNKVRYKPKLFKSLNVNFVVDDCFSEKSLKIIKKYVKGTPVLFICDGGDKAKEFNTFTPLLPVGSVVSVHDWNKEVNMQGIGETVDKFQMHPIKKDQWDAAPHHILMAFFVKTIYKEEEKDNRMKIFVGIPNTGNIRTDLVQWLLRLRKNKEYRFDIYTAGGNTLVHNRNAIVREFLKGKAEWLMNIDDDVCPPLNIFDILKNGKKIIAPVNLVWKSWGLAPLISKKAKTKGYIITDPEAAKSKEFLVEVDGTGTTCLFIHREVIEKMKPPYFMFKYDKEGALSLGEDYYFCRKAKKLGYGIWIDKRFVTDHYKNTSLKLFNNYLIKEVGLAEKEYAKKIKKELENYEIRKKK